ncbi:MAG: hypothetical protein JWR51_1223 [Devosia sp.]|uniref:hypothetical protein n=1 Tax=Devosia sp. TaxID=1871048 RepID=UPI00262594FA|nr:hypothetical protein [Devosia sp.]MDB5528120.1 hypothetical protein [Devosia sp.]
MTAAHAQARLPLDDTDLPALIVLGRDDTNKPHAAWFDQTEISGATAAALLMAMMALPVTTDDVRALADKLPHGRLFGSGKAFVPFVKAATYDALVAHVPVAQQIRPLRIVKSEAEGNESPANPADSKPVDASLAAKSGDSPITVPQDWSKVGPGCLVLAVSDNKADGWYEAVILKAKGNTSFTLRWRDYPDEEHIERPLSGIALLHPTRSATD